MPGTPAQDVGGTNLGSLFTSPSAGSDSRSTRSTSLGRSAPRAAPRPPGPAGCDTRSRPSRSTSPRRRAAVLAEVRFPLLPKLIGGLEPLVGGEVVLEEVVAGAGDVAADLVDGLVLAAEPSGERASTSSRARLPPPGRPSTATPPAARRRRWPGAGVHLAGLHRAALGDPAGEAAVEDGHRIVPHEAQHPPQARRVYPVS